MVGHRGVCCDLVPWLPFLSPFSMVHALKDGIEAVFAPNCEVITETAE